jgi:hypothetical protein
MKIGYPIGLLFPFLILFSSCEKVINVDLKNTAPTVIIEGIITDESGLLSHKVLVSKSTNFSSTGKNNPVVGAVVIVEDATDKITDTLLELKPGEYTTQSILGIVGHTYTLKVIVDGVNYTATSTMPKEVSLDSLYVQKIPFFGNDFKQVIPVFKDPIGSENFYRFSIQVNDSLQRKFEAWDDLLSDGKVNSRPLQIENQDLLDGDDTVLITMNTTDKALYNFFYTLENASGNGQTPGNPLSNISGKAIGYFGAITVKKKTLIIP